jgi:putative Mg2+ transporter-C (MgtC) family protein
MKDLEFLLFISDKMFYAILCGIVVGFERKLNRSPAAFKTQILICVGSMLFTAMACFSDDLKPQGARIVAQIVSGIGFLGAGAIIRNNSMSVMGLTTAAWIWFTASMGIMIGLSYGMSATFVSITLTGVITIMRKLERTYFDKNQHHVQLLSKEVSEEDHHHDDKKSA